MIDPDDFSLLLAPQIRLHGPVDINMYASFRSVMDSFAGTTLVVGMTTLGGDPEVARVMGEDIRLYCQQSGCRALFLGRVAVYSAGATFMSFFRSENRFCTHGTRIMIHERQLTRSFSVDGPLRSCVAKLKGALHEIEESIRIEEEGFANLIIDSDITMDQVRERAHDNWYIIAEEAKERGLIADVL